MGSGHRYKGSGKLEQEEKPVAETSVVSYTSIKETRLLRSIYPADVSVIGSVTGKNYRWPQIGHVESVDVEDYDLLLAKRVGGKGCCGTENPDGNRLFESVDGG